MGAFNEWNNVAQNHFAGLLKISGNREKFCDLLRGCLLAPPQMKFAFEIR